MPDWAIKLSDLGRTLRRYPNREGSASMAGSGRVGKTRDEYWQEMYAQAMEVFTEIRPQWSADTTERFAKHYADVKATRLYGSGRKEKS